MNDMTNPLQGTAHWLAERAGCLTASRMKDALDITKKGEPGAKRIKLLKDLVAERMTGDSVRHYVTDAMEWGITTEPEARAQYEAVSGNVVQLAGFIKHPTIEWCGCSPDGLIDDDGMLEIKCPTTSTHVDWLLKGEPPAEHRPQMLLQLATTRRRYVDFVSYDPRVKSEKSRLFVRRYIPEQAEIDAIEEAARQFLAEVEEIFERITTLEAA